MQPGVNQIFEAVYTELHHIASGLMRLEHRPNQTLQPTALVNEAYCRLVDQSRVGWENRAHFFGTAARAMRQILVDQARKRSADKRGGDWQQITFDERLGAGIEPDLQILDLNNALTRLAGKDERMAKIVELRIFGGMSAKEVAHVLGVSRQTVQDDWRMARMWLSRELSEGSTS
jgi:RNA polymerase sigma factor (TIGR02999 family)